jgi:Mg2+ and Co2+ transporter CorA
MIDEHPEFMSPPLFSFSDSLPERPPGSAYETLLYTLRHEIDRKEATTVPGNLFAIIDGALQKIVMEWSNVNHIIESELTKIEFEREVEIRQSLQSLQKNLIALHNWKRHSMKYHSTLMHSIDVCRDKCPPGWKDGVEGQSMTESRSADFENLLYDFETLKNRAENQVNVVSGQISIEIGYLAVDEAARMRRLTIAALFFLPMSLVTGLLSMGDSFALNSTRWWIFFVAAIPLTIVVIYVGMRDSTPKQERLKPKQFDELNSSWLEALGMSY